MKLSNLLFAAAAATIWTACSNDTENDSNALQALQVQANIATTTRVSGGAFVKDDAIGLHVISTATNGLTSGSNVKYTAQDANGNFTSTTPVYYKDQNAVNIYAYYPYTESLSSNAVTVKLTDQTDWLYAKNEQVTYNTAKPTLTFDHVLTQFVLTLKAGTGVSDLKALSTLTLKNIPSEGSFQTQTGALTVTKSTGYSLSNISLAAGTKEQSYTILLFPISGTTDAPAEIPVELSYDGATYSVTLKASEGMKAGKSYSYTVNITRTGLTVGSASINSWGTAINQGNSDAVIQPESSSNSSTTNNNDKETA
jgi:hypothetical protein